MYELLSKHYNNLFPLNPLYQDFLFAYAKKGGIALDLGSGTGRLSNIMNILGMHVTGVDLDSNMVMQASKAYPKIAFSEDDMIEYVKTSHESYDLITCFGNSLCHLDMSQLESLFDHISLKLNKNGYFIVELLNYYKLLKEKPDGLKDLIYDDLLLKRNYTYYKNHIMFQTVLFHEDQFEILGETKLYPYTYHQLQDLGLRYGLKSDVFGKADGTPYLYEGSHVYIIFQRKG